MGWRHSGHSGGSGGGALDADGAAEGLRERLRLGHLHGENLRGGHHGEGRLLAQRLGHAHGDRRLAGARLPGQQHTTPRDLAVLDHLGDHARSLQARGGI
jgi:hypothetical protein